MTNQQIADYPVVHADAIKDENIVNLGRNGIGYGRGCRYLETLTPTEKGVYVAWQWRRQRPKSLEPGHMLIEFSA